MAARSIASLTISFGLVSIPVKLIRLPRRVPFRSTCCTRPCGSRLKQQYVCVKEGPGAATWSRARFPSRRTSRRLPTGYRRPPRCRYTRPGQTQRGRLDGSRSKCVLHPFDREGRLTQVRVPTLRILKEEERPLQLSALLQLCPVVELRGGDLLVYRHGIFRLERLQRIKGLRDLLEVLAAPGRLDVGPQALFQLLIGRFDRRGGCAATGVSTTGSATGAMTGGVYVSATG